MTARTPAMRWVEAGWGYKVSSAEQLIRIIGRISTIRSGRKYAWRGQHASGYQLSSSLYRYLLKTGPVDEGRMRETEKRIVREARRYGLGRDLGGANTDAHLLSTLQHHGSPTRLLDVTSNPFTALWFAAERSLDGPQTAGVLFAIDVTEMPFFYTLDEFPTTLAQITNPLSAGYYSRLRQTKIDGRPFRLFPAVPDDRMRAQEGFFVGGAMPDAPPIPGVMDLGLSVGEPPGSDAIARLVGPQDRGPGRPIGLPFFALVIPPNVKAALSDPLRGTFNRRRRVLFPDVDGFRDSLIRDELDLHTPAWRFPDAELDAEVGNTTNDHGGSGGVASPEDP